MSSLTQLAGTEHGAALELLRVFAFGTLADYRGARVAPGLCTRVRRSAHTPRRTAASPALPPLSPPQLLKLKQLTVASLAEGNKARRQACWAMLLAFSHPPLQLLSYAALADALETPLTSGGSVRSLEDFIINQCFAPVRPLEFTQPRTHTPLLTLLSPRACLRASWTSAARVWT